MYFRSFFFAKLFSIYIFLESNEILDKYLRVNLIEKAVLIKIDVKNYIWHDKCLADVLSLFLGKIIANGQLNSEKKL